MPRRTRLQCATDTYHVTNRGVDHRAIVGDDHDRRTWFRLFDRAARRFDWRVFAYCLLDNHFHLYLRAVLAALSDGMHDFEGGYATLFNKRHNRTGALFEGRFHPEPVESEGHSWEVSRYIHLNPVRAGIVDDPAKYAWSSYGYYLDPKGAPPWLDWRTVLADFAGTEAAARLAYCRYVQAGIRNPPRNPFEDLSRVDKSDRRSVIGDCSNADSSDLMSPTAAVAKCKPILTPEQELNRIVSAIAEQFGATVESIRSRGRHGNSAREAAIFVCRETLPSRLKVLAEYFGGVSLSAITESARRARQRMETDTTFRERIHRITD